LGEFDRAVPIARRLQALEKTNQIAGLVLLAASIKAQDWPGVQAALDAGVSVGGTLDELIRGWALFGQGEQDAAIAVFDAMGDAGDAGQISAYNRAVAHALAGDFEHAAEVLSGGGDGARPSFC